MNHQNIEHNTYPQNHFYCLPSPLSQNYINPFPFQFYTPIIPNFSLNCVESNCTADKINHFPQQTEVKKQNSLSQDPELQRHFDSEQAKGSGYCQKEETPKKKKNFRPKIAHLAKFFDPCEAPSITSQNYYSIQRLLENPSQKNLLQGQRIKEGSSVLSPQVNDNPFIIFKYKRVKKRYRKYAGMRNGRMSLQSDGQNDKWEESERQPEKSDAKQIDEDYGLKVQESREDNS